MLDIQEMLREVLRLTGHTDDLDDEYSVLWDRVQLSSLIYLLNNLPEERKDKASDAFSKNPNDYSVLMVEIDNFYSQADKDKSLRETADQIVRDYILDNSENLTEFQKLELAKYLELRNSN